MREWAASSIPICFRLKGKEVRLKRKIHSRLSTYGIHSIVQNYMTRMNHEHLPTQSYLAHSWSWYWLENNIENSSGVTQSDVFGIFAHILKASSKHLCTVGTEHWQDVSTSRFFILLFSSVRQSKSVFYSWSVGKESLLTFPNGAGVFTTFLHNNMRIHLLKQILVLKLILHDE